MKMAIDTARGMEHLEVRQLRHHSDTYHSAPLGGGVVWQSVVRGGVMCDVWRVCVCVCGVVCMCVCVCV